MLNALHLPDFHRSWVEQGLIAPQDFNIGMLFYPEYLRVDTAPAYLKDQIKQKYQQHLEWLRPLDKVGRAVYSFESVVNYIQTDRTFNTALFWKEINQLDNANKNDKRNVNKRVQIVF
jgi:hypothetical protein